MAPHSEKPSQTLVQALASGSFIIIFGGALGSQLGACPAKQRPHALLQSLAKNSDFPSSEPRTLFRVLEWATDKIGRHVVIDQLASFLDLKAKWSLDALTNVLELRPKLVLSMWYDPRLLKGFTPALRRKTRVILRDSDLSLLDGNEIIPFFPVLGTLDHPSSVVLDEKQYQELLRVGNFFHSYCTGYLATCAWLFLGFD
jgi:hypothetical protein